MNEMQPEDELVRIEAESAELITMGFLHGELDMPNCVVPLSKAISRMDEFSKEVTEHWSGLDGRRVYYRVYACKDDFHLFDYMDGEICSDHRKGERPGSPEKVYFRLMDGETTPSQLVCLDEMEYAEWAERKLAERWADVMERSDTYQKWDRESKHWVKVRPENLFFDIYGDKRGMDYRYSYKNGKIYIRPRTEEEKEKKEHRKKDSVVERERVEEVPKTYDALPFMKKK